MCVASKGAVECQVAQLRDDGRQVLFLQQVPHPIHLAGVQEHVVHFKIVELPLIYDQVMVCYQLHTPPRAGATQGGWMDSCYKYLKLWVGLLVAEKRRQMQTPREEWPDIAWEVKGVWGMPIVLWLSKEASSASWY